MRSSASFSKRRQSTGLQAAVEMAFSSDFRIAHPQKGNIQILVGRAVKETLLQTAERSQNLPFKDRCSLGGFWAFCASLGSFAFAFVTFFLLKWGPQKDSSLAHPLSQFCCHPTPQAVPSSGARLARHCGMRGGLRHRGKGSARACFTGCRCRYSSQRSCHLL